MVTIDADSAEFNRDNDDDRPFTNEERARLRAILVKEERAVWFWATVRVWAGWAAGVVGAYFAVKSFFADVIGGLPK